MNTDQAEIINGLRELANFLETKEFDLSDACFNFPELYLFCSNGQSFLNNTKKLGGFKREFSNYSANLVKSFGFGRVKFILHSSREMVCEKVKVGVEVLPAEPERVIEAKPERVVDKYEYKCPESLLKENV